MNANDVRMYERSIEIAGRHGIKVELYAEVFRLSSKYGGGLGHMPTVDALYHYVCGYDAGHCHGEMEGFKKSKKKGKRK